MDRANSQVYRNCMGTLFLAFVGGGAVQPLGAPDPLPAVVAAAVFIGTPAMVLLGTIKH